MWHLTLNVLIMTLNFKVEFMILNLCKYSTQQHVKLSSPDLLNEKGSDKTSVAHQFCASFRSFGSFRSVALRIFSRNRHNRLVLMFPWLFSQGCIIFISHAVVVLLTQHLECSYFSFWNFYPFLFLGNTSELHFVSWALQSLIFLFSNSIFFCFSDDRLSVEFALWLLKLKIGV